MTGKQVKDTLYILGVKLGKLAEDMGMTQQNFSAALIERLRAYCIRGYQHIINGVINGLSTQTKQASFI